MFIYNLPSILRRYNSSKSPMPISLPSFPLKLLLAISLLALLGLYVLNVSRPGRIMEGCPEECSTAPDRRAGPLRVVSLNMLHGFPLFQNLDLRVSLISGEIKRLDADVVLLQEVPWTITTGNVAKELSERLGYNYLFSRAAGNKKLIFFEEGGAILSRYPLIDIVFTELHPVVSFYEHRVVIGATAITPVGEIRFFGAHLTHANSKANESQVDALKNFVEANTTGLGIVGGDFNATGDSPSIQMLDRVWTDTYHVAHPNDAGLTCCVDTLNAAPGEPLEMRIDYIFLVHPRGKLISAEHAFYAPFQVKDGWKWVSDHTGLMIEIEP